jgi:glutathione S-transferase
MAMTGAAAQAIRVHGLDLSYFTGKLEGYLRLKGAPYALVEMDTRSFEALGRRTGVRQMPQVELPDGTWLTDTPRIIDTLEQTLPGPGLTPEEPVAAFAAHLLEAYADEWLWRPALYYRWAFADDARLMSGRLARGMLRDVPAPVFLRRHFIRARQRRVYLAQDGVTSATAPVIERLYRDTLTALQAVFSAQPFVQGARATRADVGFFGPMFRHFFCDPTPAKIMRDAAPAALEWTARIWLGGIDPAAPLPVGAPALPTILTDEISERFLPYMIANAAAGAAGQARVRWRAHGVDFVTPVSPYRAWRWDRLMGRFQALDTAARDGVAAWLGGAACERLAASRTAPFWEGAERRVRDRTWRPARQ